MTYDKCISNYKKHIDSPYNKWLKFYKNYKSGKQGTTGLLEDEDGNKYAFKISQYMNYLAEHEYTVMHGLDKIIKFCPFFPHVYGHKTTEINSNRDGDPFKLEKDKPQVRKNILLMEEIESSKKMSRLIKNPDYNEPILYSLIKQTLLAVKVAQQVCKFVHYDLHSDNILIKKCNPDMVFLFKIDEDNKFLVPTLGYYPTMIDFGFSYIDNMDNDFLWPSLGHTDVGFTSCIYDWVADPKLFLITTSCELEQYRETHVAERFRTIVENIFDPLDIEWDCGWDHDDNSIAHKLGEKLDVYETRSYLFHKYQNYCIDLIQSLIILPLEPKTTEDMEDAYLAFVNEFLKIEDQITSTYYNLYILKGIVDSARKIQGDYHHVDTREAAVRHFKRGIYECIDSVVKFCMPKNINFERMLCSLILLAKSMEGFYYDELKAKMDNKQKQYDKLPLKNVEQIYACIDVNIPTKYTYTRDTKVVVIDVPNMSKYTHNLTEHEISQLNKTHPICRGSVFKYI